jgi:hypothetical protein
MIWRDFRAKRVFMDRALHFPDGNYGERPPKLRPKYGKLFLVTM